MVLIATSSACVPRYQNMLISKTARQWCLCRDDGSAVYVGMMVALSM